MFTRTQQQIAYEELSHQAAEQLHANFKANVAREAAEIAAKSGNDSPQAVELIGKIILQALRQRLPAHKLDLASVAQEGLEALKQKFATRARKDNPLKPLQQAEVKDAAERRRLHPDVAAVFGDRDRIYLKIEKSGPSRAQVAVEKALADMGYRVTDYDEGHATDVQGKQTFRIGKLLKDKMGLLNAFTDDSSRSLHQTRVVISRNADDIARLSTNRPWWTCFAADGFNWYYVPKDIEAGSLVAYLVSENDPEIHAPLARILLRAYEPRSGDYAMWQKFSGEDGSDYREYKPLAAAIGRGALRLKWKLAGGDGAQEPPPGYVLDAACGLTNKAFESAVEQFARDHLRAGPNGTYKMPAQLYPNGMRRYVTKKGADMGGTW